MTDDTNQNKDAQQATEEVVNRRQKLEQLRQQGAVFVNDFDRNALAGELHERYDSYEASELASEQIKVSVAGRIMTRRVMGKASFFHLQDRSGQIQIYVKRDVIGSELFEAYKELWDLGDIVGVKGEVFKTKTGELSVKADEIKMLTKSVRPLPDKFHGLVDQEQRYRQRYLDLTMNEHTRQTFKTRSQIVSFVRRFFEKHRFMEVETPMMHPIPGGAAARPFITHHNALDMELFLRIAPELYLKRLLVGGLEQVFEINRNFRNEGLSTRHNPEFTMLEFYQAYKDYHALMDLTESFMRELLREVVGSEIISFDQQTCDFSRPFERMTLKEAVLRYNPELSAENLDDFEKAKAYANKLGISIHPHYGLGRVWQELFEETAEDKLFHPTFITEFPAEVSPLARLKDSDPFVTDRFEFFAAGFEIANGFSELNDPDEQARRFKQQADEREAGEDEAMVYDADFIHALQHAMPPAAGEGIGIDRLVMLLTGHASIREVVLFPQLRPKSE